MNIETLVAKRLAHSQDLIEQCSNEQNRINEEIKGLEKAYDQQEVIKSKTEIEIALLAELRTFGKGTQTPKNHPLPVRANSLTPLQSTVMNLLPDNKYAAMSTTEIYHAVSLSDNPVHRKTSLHRILQSLESKRLASFIKTGRAHHWYKI